MTVKPLPFATSPLGGASHGRDDAVRMAPPLVLRPDQVDTAVALLEETLVEVAGA